MESDNSDTSTSDEEYIPPTKLSKAECDSDASSDESEGDPEDDSDREAGGVKKKRSLQHERATDEKCNTHEKEAERKAREDAIWNEFMSSVEHPKEKQSTKEYVEVSKKYQFAGEEIQVTERISVEKEVYQNNPTPSQPEKTVPNDSTVSVPISSRNTSSVPATKTPIIAKSSGLASALNNLKSLTGSKTPKLSTLEKSRMDWENFIRKENIEDDLKAHNKGKQGYLERRAFIDRTSEREYAYQKSQTSRKT